MLIWFRVKGLLDQSQGGTYLRGKSKARLAQSVEQLTFNQWVAGSIPAARTNLFNDLRAIHARSISQKVTFDHMHFHYPLIRVNGYV